MAHNPGMVLDVALLGTGGTLPLPGRWLASALVRWNGHLILFDCGEGTQISLRALGWGLVGIDLILLSHVHGDHVGGLPGLLLSQANGGRTEPVTIVGPVGARHVVDGLRVIAPRLPFAADCVELPTGGGFDFGGMEVSALPTEHSVPCLAYRLAVPRGRRFLAERARRLDIPVELWRQLQRGRSVTVDGRTVAPDAVLGPPRPGLAVGLVTDTRPSDRLAAFLAGVDLLVCEGMYGDSDQQARASERKHMTFAEAAGLAQRAGAKRLVLSHFSPSLTDPQAYAAEATRVFADTIVGHDHLQLSLRFPDEPD
jgi:ribonuclease Z